MDALKGRKTEAVALRGEARTKLARSAFGPEWEGGPPKSFDSFRRRFEVSREWFSLFDALVRSRWDESHSRVEHPYLEPAPVVRWSNSMASSLGHVLWIIHREVNAARNPVAGVAPPASFGLSAEAVEPSSAGDEIVVPHVSLTVLHSRTSPEKAKGDAAGQLLLYDPEVAKERLIVGFNELDRKNPEVVWQPVSDLVSWPEKCPRPHFLPWPSYRPFYEDRGAQVVCAFRPAGSRMTVASINEFEGCDLDAICRAWMSSRQDMGAMPHLPPGRTDPFTRFADDAVKPYVDFKCELFARSRSDLSSSRSRLPAVALLIGFAIPAEEIQEGAEFDGLYAFASIEVFNAEGSALPSPWQLSQAIGKSLQTTKEPLLRQLASERLQEARDKRDEMQRHRDVLEAITPTVEMVNNTLARLQNSVQLVNNYVAMPPDNLFRAYRDVGKLFKPDERISVAGVRGSFPVNHGGRYSNPAQAATVIALAVAHFLGLPEEQITTLFRMMNMAAAWSGTKSLDAAEQLLRRVDAALLREASPHTVRSVRAIFATREELAHFHKGMDSGSMKFMPDGVDRNRLPALLQERVEKCLKSRYYEILKWDRPKAVRVHHLLPYLNLHPFELDPESILWDEDAHRFSNQEPVIRLLASVFNARVGAGRNRFRSYFTVTSESRTTVFTLYKETSSTAKPDHLSADLSPASSEAPEQVLGGLASTLAREQEHFSHAPATHQHLGYYRGDFVSPMIELLHGVPIPRMGKKDIRILNDQKFPIAGEQAPLAGIQFVESGWGIAYWGRSSIVMGDLQHAEGMK